MNRIIKLTDAKVPPLFKTEKAKRKNDTKPISIKTSKRRLQNQANNTNQNELSTGQPAKRRRKCTNADLKSDNVVIHGQKYKSEVQLELDRLNNQLKWVNNIRYKSFKRF